MSKYKEMFRGEFAPRVALEALKRKVGTHAGRLDRLEDSEKARTEAAAAAAAARAEDTDLLYVSRAELREAVESGEVPEAWNAPPQEPADG